MKVFLLHRDRDADVKAPLPPQAEALTRDLGLDAVLTAAATGDKFVLDVVRRTVLHPLDDPDAIRYRQGILADCLAHPAVIRELYNLSVDAIERERRIWGVASTRFPDTLLQRSVEVLGVELGILKRFRRLTEEQAGTFASEGFGRFFAMIATDLDDAYLAIVTDHLARLKFTDGIVVSAGLGPGNRGTGYVLRKRIRRSGWRDKLGLPDRPGYVYSVPERDENGFRMMSEVAGRGSALAATALAQSTENIISFFKVLRAELAFYLGMVNLQAVVAATGAPTCLPDPGPIGKASLTARGLYDIGLPLSGAASVVGNDVDAPGRTLVVMTGPNQGGKTAFLRAIGQAQLLMQSGAFVPAVSFAADVRGAVFTHFRREEDIELRSGKLDEELLRMSEVVDALPPTGMLLLNESFASTNEREGSEIARQVVHGLLESGVKVVFVTHLFDLAGGLHAEGRPDALFLRAERRADGTRTFRLREGEPLPTSHGADVYRRVFPEGAAATLRDQAEVSPV